MNNLTFNISEIDWTETGTLVAILISLISAGITGLARQDSKKSAGEAEKARKIARTDLLAVHFNNVEYLCNRVSGAGSSEDDQSKIAAAKESEAILQSFLSDSKVSALLLDLVNTYDKYSVKRLAGTKFSFINNITSEFDNTDELDGLRTQMSIIKKEFDQVKSKYLHIE